MSNAPIGEAPSEGLVNAIHAINKLTPQEFTLLIGTIVRDDFTPNERIEFVTILMAVMQPAELGKAYVKAMTGRPEEYYDQMATAINEAPGPFTAFKQGRN